MAAGLISGGIRVFDCSGAELRQTTSSDKHSDSCRSVGFAGKGDALLSCSADKSLRAFDVETGQLIFRRKSAHDCAVERHALAIPSHQILNAISPEESALLHGTCLLYPKPSGLGSYCIEAIVSQPWSTTKISLFPCRILHLHDTTFASGDENGVIKTWDWRMKSPTAEYTAHTDFVSDLTFHEAETCLLAVSGDGSLSINDLQSQKVSFPSSTLPL